MMSLNDGQYRNLGLINLKLGEARESSRKAKNYVKKMKSNGFNLAPKRAARSIKEYWKGKTLIDEVNNRLAYTKAVERVLSVPCEHALEIGSGSGRWRRRLKCDYYVGVEIDAEACKVSKELFDETESVIRADARMLPLRGNSFDLVFSLGTVEHFEETFLSVLEHARVCREGGRVVISVPHKFSIGAFFEKIRRILLHISPSDAVVDFGKRFTVSEFITLFEEIDDLTIDRIERIGVSLPFPFERYLSPLSGMIGNEIFLRATKKRFVPGSI